MALTFEIQHAVCGYDSIAVVKDVSLTVNTGEILCLLGPNGVGKTTLFKSIMGFLPMQSGQILLDGENIQHWSRRKLAGVFGYVPQTHIPPFPFKVLDVVVMGRTAHMGVFSSPSASDKEIALQTLYELGIGFLADRIYTEISGGERQMVMIARALTQMPRILFMDEPTSNLDYGNQVRVLCQINKLAEKGLSIIMTSHFPNHALLCSTNVALMQPGKPLITGDAETVITEGNLKAAYGVDVRIASVEYLDGRCIKTCVPIV